MWVAVIAFKKAFDSVQLAAIWRSLRNHSVSEQYICFLKILYIDQFATVVIDVENDEFGLVRGTKQSGFLMNFLNSVLQSAMEKDSEN